MTFFEHINGVNPFDSSHKCFCLPTDFKPLDDIIGGFACGYLTTIAGLPGARQDNFLYSMFIKKYSNRFMSMLVEYTLRYLVLAECGLIPPVNIYPSVRFGMVVIEVVALPSYQLSLWGVAVSVCYSSEVAETVLYFGRQFFVGEHSAGKVYHCFGFSDSIGCIHVIFPIPFFAYLPPEA